MGMDDKLEKVIEQYSLNISSRKRMRGAVLLDTDKGLYIAKSYSGSVKSIEFQERIKTMLSEDGHVLVDTTIHNLAGEYISTDNSGGCWIVQKWYPGDECDVKDIRKVCMATRSLAIMHRCMVLPCGFEIEIKKDKVDIVEVFDKHNKEIKRVHGYIKNKRQKNDMEICLLNSYKQFYDQGISAIEYIQNGNKMQKLNSSVIDNADNTVYHGSYNYHNVVFSNGKIAVTNFDKANVGLQVTDLYDFMRKVMEKNGWRMEMGIRMLDAYMKERKLTDEERNVLYAMLLYPEKYWKLINFYYNGKKSWMSVKNYEKLQRICSQETERQKFLLQVKKLLF